MNSAQRSLALALAVAFLPIASAQTILVTGFAPGQWGAADATLGISGYTIATFESTTLPAGLSIGWASEAGDVTPATTLPNTFDPVAEDPNGNAFDLGSWDGSNVVVNTRTNQSYSYSAVANWGDILISFSTPVSSVGFSIQQNEEDIALFINGTSMGGMEALSGLTADGARFGYVRIDGTGGTTLSSVRLNNDRSSFYDGFVIDHLAFAPIPEPATAAVLLAGPILIAAMFCRRVFRRNCRASLKTAAPRQPDGRKRETARSVVQTSLMLAAPAMTKFLAQALRMLLLAVSLALSARAQVIYGVASVQGGPSSLYQINPSNGAATLIGATALNGMSAIAFHPVTGTLYGVGRSGLTFVVATINTTTGFATPIAATSAGANPTNPFFADMSFSSTGTLFATEPNGSILYTIDITTGATTRVPPGASSPQWVGRGFALSFLPGDDLYHSDGTVIGTLDQSTGLYTGTPATLRS